MARTRTTERCGRSDPSDEYDPGGAVKKARRIFFFFFALNSSCLSRKIMPTSERSRRKRSRKGCHCRCLEVRDPTW